VVKARNVDLVERGGIGKIAWLCFQNDAILVRLRIDRGDLALAEGVVERIVDGLNIDAEPAGLFALDRDVRPQSALLRLQRDIFERARLPQSCGKLGRRRGDFVRIRARQRILILRAARARRDLDILHRLDEGRRARHFGREHSQPLADVCCRRGASLARAKRHGHPRHVRRRIQLADANDGNDAGDVGIPLQFGGDATLQAPHFGERRIRAALQDD
jgi:hypothetical protein